MVDALRVDVAKCPNARVVPAGRKFIPGVGGSYRCGQLCRLRSAELINDRHGLDAHSGDPLDEFHNVGRVVVFVAQSFGSLTIPGALSVVT